MIVGPSRMKEEDAKAVLLAGTILESPNDWPSDPVQQWRTVAAIEAYAVLWGRQCPDQAMYRSMVDDLMPIVRTLQ